ncbi:ATP-binding protein [Zobellia sp.]|nr:ATP-binding protein [Zobellia sp.]
MFGIQTSLQLVEQLETFSLQENNQEAFNNLVHLLKKNLLKDKEDSDLLAQNLEVGIAKCKIIENEEGEPINYRFIWVNNAFELQSGIPAAKALGKTIVEIFPDIEKFWIKFFGNVALTQQPDAITRYSKITKRHYTCSAYSITKGEFIMCFKDVSDSRELETAHFEIYKKQEQNSAILDNMQEAFAHCEIICDDQNRPIDWKTLATNKAYEQQTGIKLCDILSKTILEIFPDFEQSWIETLGQVALSGKPHSFVNFNHNTGKYYRTNTFSPKKGEFISIFGDITDQETKRLELEKAYLKAEENKKLKSTFLANMSHEIRTPMNGILGLSDLLEDDTISAEDKKKCIQQIKSSGKQLLTIISDIVDISIIESEQQKLVFEKCDLHKLLENLLDRFSVLNTKPDIELKIEKENKEEMFNVVTDEKRLTQILSNLIENALKFTENGQVIFGYSIIGDRLQFYVKDSGIGIKKEDQKLIFERFGSQKTAYSGTNSGTGLGIPIAKGLVQLFGGDLCVKSEIEKGSTFYFSIPYNPTSREVANKSHKYTILIAEDDDVNFLLLDLWLNSLFNIIRAKDGFEVVSLFEKSDAIDLILMDIKMPCMDGIDATKEIRKMDMHVPIIAHTAYAMNEESLDITLAGCNKVLIKPIVRDTLLGIMAEYGVVV